MEETFTGTFEVQGH